MKRRGEKVLEGLCHEQEGGAGKGDLVVKTRGGYEAHRGGTSRRIPGGEQIQV